jgi:site-specific DNA-cytosine methylase
VNHRWQTVLAVDSDRWACETYRANFPGVRVDCATVADLIGQLPAADILLGGPPCQPFSDVGENEGEADDRDCIPDFIAAVGKVRPRQFLMENVRGLLKEKHLPYFGRALRQLESLGYRVDYRLLDAVSFGVPQFRERVWVWGIRNNVDARHCWPKPTHTWPPPLPCMFGAALLPGVTVRQALGLDGMLHRKRGKGMTARAGGRRDHPTNEPSPAITAAFALGGGGGLFLKSHADHPVSVDRPAPTLRSGGNGHDGCCPRLAYDHGVAELDAPSPTIKAGGNRDVSGKQGGGCPPVVRVVGGGRNYPADANGKYRRDVRDITDEPSTTIVGTFVGGQIPHVVSIDAPSHMISGSSREPIQNWRDKGYVRRLTAIECARLQSVPDDFTWPAKITKTNQYRIVGNGWASSIVGMISPVPHHTRIRPLAAPLVRCRRCGDAYPGAYFVVVRGVGVCKYCRRWGVPRGKGARA